MKIVVLNGSPKGDISVTMQYINYIQKRFKQHELKIINISQRINQIEKDKEVFESIISYVKSSDGVIWAFPLYVFTVHSNYQRFIELIFERNVENAFKAKYTSILATSIHFYDHTAVNYMNSILVLMSKFPSIRKKLYSNKAKSSIIEPLKKIVEDETV